MTFEGERANLEIILTYLLWLCIG